MHAHESYTKSGFSLLSEITKYLRFYNKLHIFMFCWCKISFNCVLAIFRLYLKEEHKAKKDRELDETKWTVGNLKTTVNITDITKLLFSMTD